MLGAKTAMTIHDFSVRLGTGEERQYTQERQFAKYVALLHAGILAASAAQES